LDRVPTVSRLASPSAPTCEWQWMSSSARARSIGRRERDLPERRRMRRPARRRAAVGSGHESFGRRLLSLAQLCVGGLHSRTRESLSPGAVAQRSSELADRIDRAPRVGDRLRMGCAEGKFGRLSRPDRAARVQPSFPRPATDHACVWRMQSRRVGAKHAERGFGRPDCVRILTAPASRPTGPHLPLCYDPGGPEPQLSEPCVTP